LERVDIGFKNLGGSGDRVSDNDDIVHVIILHNRNEVYMDGYKLSFGRHNIYGLTLELFCYMVVIPNVGYSIYNIGFFNPAICNNSCIIWGILRLTKGLVEVLDMFVNVFRKGG